MEMRGRRGTGVAVALWLVAMVVTLRYVLRAWQTRAPWNAHVPYSQVGMTDFRDTAMLPNLARAQSVNPYDLPRYLKLFPQAQEFDAYGPWWLTVTRPFSRMGWDNATLAYLSCLALAVLLVSWWVGLQLCDALQFPRRLAPLLAPLAVLAAWAWRPLTVAFGLGNVSTVVPMVVGIALLSRNRSVGIVAVALCWVKPQFAVPLCLVLAAWPGRGRRALWGTLLAGVASLPAVIQLSRIAGGLPQLVGSVLHGASTMGSSDARHLMAGRIDIAILLDAFGWRPGVLASIAVGAVLFAPAVWASRRLVQADEPQTASLLAVMAILGVFPHFHYDLTAALVPVLLVLARSWGLHRRRAPLGVARWAAVASSVIITLGCLVPGGLVSSFALHDRLLAASLWIGIALLIPYGLLMADELRPSGRRSLAERAAS